MQAVMISPELSVGSPPIVTLTADPGSSLGKCIYLIEGKPQLLLIDPDAAVVSRESIASYEEKRMGKASPEDSAWVCAGGECRVIGFLARRQNFLGSVRLDERKYQRAAWTVCAIVGSIAQKHDLPEVFTLHLSTFLPYSEWNDRGKFKDLCEKLLSDFEFRGQHYAVRFGLTDFKPEGGGLVLVRQAQMTPHVFRRAVLVVLMLGHRDATVLVLERGELTKGSTAKIGFTRLTDAVASYASVNQPSQLTQAVYCAGEALKEDQLKPLADDEADLQQIKAAIKVARVDYWQALKTWMDSTLSALGKVDQVVIGGGAAGYLKKPLQGYFKGATLSWGAELEPQVKEVFGDVPEIQSDQLTSRLTDAYALFCSFSKKVAN